MSKRRILSIILVFLILLSTSAFALDETEFVMLSDEAHVYSIVPGTAAWNELSPSERYEACSVSEQEVKNMTTAALVETVLNYPYLINIYAYDSFELGISEVSNYFPGLPELFGRRDAIRELNKFVDEHIAAMSEGADTVDLALYDAYNLMGYIGAAEAQSGTSINTD